MSIRVKAIHRDYIISEYIIYALIIGIGNVLFSDYYILGTAFSFVQVIYLILSYYTGKKSRAVCELFISMALAQEFYTMESQLCYSVKSIRFLGVNLIFWVLFFFTIEAILDKRLWGMLVRRYGNSLTKLVRGICIINILGLFLGVINVFLFNDNNVKSIPNYGVTFIEMVYSFIGLVVFPVLLLFWRYLEDPDFVDKIKESLTGVFGAVFVSIGVSLALGKYTVGWAGTEINLSPVGMYLPYLILFPFYKGEKHKYRWLAVGLIGIIAGIYFWPGGKGMISLFPLAVVMLFLLFKGHNRKICLLMLGLIIPIGIATFFVMRDRLTNGIISKWYYAVTLLDVTNPDWWSLIPPSPKWRIVELINIISEFIEKPYMLLLGKGYMGTVRDYTGLLSQFSGDLSGAEAGEWITGLFYSMHETFNRLFLENGIVGLYILGQTLLKMIRRYDVSPYIFIGGFWFIFFWGYSLQMAAFGILALFAGFADITDYESRHGLYKRMEV